MSAHANRPTTRFPTRIYSGLVMSASLSYVALGSTKLGLSTSRDVQYSFEELQPYYLQTGNGRFEPSR